MTDAIDPELIERGRKLFAGDWHFIWASPSIETLPPMGALEVAFAGRSNVGKSSLINALTGRNALARTSHTPGRTQELIFFDGPKDGVFEARLLQHLRNHGSRHAKHPGQIHIKHMRPAGIVHFMKTLSKISDSGIIHQHIDFPERRNGLLHRRMSMPFISD